MPPTEKRRAEDGRLERLRQRYRQRINQLTESVATGGCRTHEEYRAVTGEIRGLYFAERELLDLDTELIGE